MNRTSEWVEIPNLKSPVVKDGIEIISNGLERFYTTYGDLKSGSHHRSDSIESQLIHSKESSNKNFDLNNDQTISTAQNQIQIMNDNELESAIINQKHLEDRLEKYEEAIKLSEDSSKSVIK